MKVRSLLWAPTIAMSWFWGLGFFYSIHVVLAYGWLGFVGFAAPNAFGLGLFGWVVGRRRMPPDLIVKSLEGAYGGAFLFFQIAAAAITIFGFLAYFWTPMFGQGAPIGAAMLVLCACAIGQGLSLSRLRRLHIAAMAAAAVAAVFTLATLWAAGPVDPAPLAAFDSRFYGLVIPTLIGFLLGPWLDLQQWQRAAAIHREGGSVGLAYAGGALLFLGLLTMNALLAAAAGKGGIVVSADGLVGHEGALSTAVARLADRMPGLAFAFAVWTVLALATTIDSAYAATRWFLAAKQARSMSPLLAMIPPGVASSPLWVMAAATGIAWEAYAANLSLMYSMLPFATLFVGPAACLVCEVLGGRRSYDATLVWLIGFAAAIVFVFGYIPPNSLLLTLAPLIALIGALPAIVGRLRPRKAAAPALAVEAAAGLPALPAAAPATAIVATHGFDGQWFVMQATPTYDDTNSVGNIYVANYIRWVGKARELFFNACMPDFNLKTTKYLVLTRSFNHVFRREAREFEPIVVRLRIASHNRKFVTLQHELYAEAGAMLGAGEQILMFVDVENSQPLDIPRDIVRGFLPYWPKESQIVRKFAASEVSRL
jgi:acyl-CoA thioesterase FadM